jgi:hypothetical protein
MTTVDYRNAFIRIADALTLMNGKTKQTIESKDLEIQKLQKQVADLQTYIKIMTDLNNEQLVSKAIKRLRKEQKEPMLDDLRKAQRPMKEQSLNAFDLIMKLTKIQRDKEEKEYEEILRNGNGNGK